MAHESFEDVMVAEVLNQDYISIKVDREERPDIDAVYMGVCQMLTGSGGWPLTILMTPEQKPFYAGTYLPKHTNYGAIGLIELLNQVIKEWKEDRDKLLHTGNVITRQLKNQLAETSERQQLSKEVLERGRDIFQKLFDEKWGGFGRAPKFPTPHNLIFLLWYGVLEEDNAVQDMVEYTLHQMYRGGIFDHIGGGFSRYSTDEMWLAPHFEKMLYDNALLAYTYLQTYTITKKTFYAETAQKVMNYVLRELTHKQGGFLCGQDADSEGEEGKYYVFTPEEIEKVLGKTDGKLYCQRYKITAEGNFEGKNIPNLIFTADYEEEEPVYQEMRERLYQYRVFRTELHLDDKVLTSWNGLMIAAMAKAYCLKDGERYIEAAIKAHAFITKNLKESDGRLLVRWRDNEAGHKGQLDDYAFYSWGLIELYQVTLDVKYLTEAIAIAGMMEEFFGDEAEGGFYLYASDSEQLISRPKEVYDGAIPSGNSVAAYVIGKLAKLTGESRWQKLWDRQISFLMSRIGDYPAGYSFALLAATEVLYSSKEVICTTPKTYFPQELMDLLKEKACFNLTVIVKNPKNEAALLNVAPYTANYPITSEDTYYLCQDNTCSLPMDFAELVKYLR